MDIKKMKKNKKLLAGVVLSVFAIVAVVGSAVGVGKAFNSTSPISFGDVGVVEINLSAPSEEGSLGGSTRSDWNVGKDLTVAGDTSLAGDLSVVGYSSINRPVSSGDVWATSSTANFSLTAAQICDSSVINVTASGAVINVTLAATSTLFADCLKVNGDSIDLLYRNINTEAASTTTIVAGDGIDLQEPDGQNVVIGGGNTALVKIVRVSATAAVAIIDETIVAD